MVCELQPRSVSVPLDLASLGEHGHDSDRYARQVSETLSGNQKLSEFLEVSRAAAQSKNVPLRIRLVIDPAARILNRIQWERASDAKTGDRLALNPEVLLTRLVPESGAPEMGALDRHPLRALIAIASPDDLLGR